MDLFESLRRRDPPPPPEIDREALLDEMSRTDPDLAHVRDVYHNALGLIGASREARKLAQRVADGQSIRHEREFWSRHGESQ